MKFDFSDINLVPKKCIVSSRSECDTSITLGKHTFNLPIVPANMECVINEELAIKLVENNYFYIMHRFCDTFEFAEKMKSLNLLISISVGVNEDSYELVKRLKESNIHPDYITIDIAHGHSIKMKSMIEFIKSNLPESFVIAGNISTMDATFDLESWGADATKVGIGPGCFIPTTKVKTSKGIKYLRDISENDYVLTHNNRYKKVIQTHSYIGDHNMIKVNNLPECTETHEFFVIDRSMKESINNDNLLQYAYWVQAKDLDKNKHLLVKM